MKAPASVRRALVAFVVASVATSAGPTAVGAAPAVGVAVEPAHQAAPTGDGQTAEPSPGELPLLSTEVLAVPVTSPEFDRLRERVDELQDRRDEFQAERAGLEQQLEADRRELVAVSALAERRSAQVDKAELAAVTTRNALADLAVDRFIEGDHLLEGLDPALSAAARDELMRQMVLADIGADRLLEEVRFTTARRDQLRSERESLTRRATELGDRIGSADRRRAELTADLDELGVTLLRTAQDLEVARRAATVEGTEMSVLALDAYWRAERALTLLDPDCRVTWPLLAGIGRTESRHGTYRDAVVGPDGVVAPPIYGPELDGSNEAFAVIPDSDGGRLDGTARTDRAVGPMQFIPSTWRAVGSDATGDGTADPQNFYDAALSAGVYLCRSGPGLDEPDRRRRAVLTYNRSGPYADLVELRRQEYEESVELG